MAYVLIIDDDQTMRSVIADKLSQAGIATKEATDGLEGLAQAQQEHPAVIILDENMPNMDGQQFIEELQKEEWFKDVHVIVFTSSTDIALLNRKMMAGVSEYLNKGTTPPETIVQLVQKHLQPGTAADNPAS